MRRPHRLGVTPARRLWQKRLVHFCGEQPFHRQLGWCPCVDDAAFLHQVDPRGQPGSQVHLMGSQHHCSAVRLDLTEQALLHQLGRDVRVHSRERVVEQEDGRPAVESASKGEARALPSGYGDASLADLRVVTDAGLVLLESAAPHHPLVPPGIELSTHQDVVSEGGVERPGGLGDVPDASAVGGRDARCARPQTHLPQKQLQDR
mmetsp:Transcript_10703/g.34388  ORF Transcript_10703/g.34388 Transcript_10703/m.34388 type:complete len:205 (-) Transcript_10703:383-997(-)